MVIPIFGPTAEFQMRLSVFISHQVQRNQPCILWASSGTAHHSNQYKKRYSQRMEFSQNTSHLPSGR